MTSKYSYFTIIGFMILLSCGNLNTYEYIEIHQIENNDKLYRSEPITIKSSTDSSAYISAAQKFFISKMAQHETEQTIGDKGISSVSFELVRKDGTRIEHEILSAKGHEEVRRTRNKIYRLDTIVDSTFISKGMFDNILSDVHDLRMLRQKWREPYQGKELLKLSKSIVQRNLKGCGSFYVKTVDSQKYLLACGINNDWTYYYCYPEIKKVSSLSNDELQRVSIRAPN